MNNKSISDRLSKITRNKTSENFLTFDLSENETTDITKGPKRFRGSRAASGSRFTGKVPASRPDFAFERGQAKKEIESVPKPELGAAVPRDTGRRAERLGLKPGRFKGSDNLVAKDTGDVGSIGQRVPTARGGFTSALGDKIDQEPRRGVPTATGADKADYYDRNTVKPKEPKPTVLDLAPGEEYPGMEPMLPNMDNVSSGRTQSTPRTNRTLSDEQLRPAEERHRRMGLGTDAVGESAFMEGLHRVLNGEFDRDMLQHVGSKNVPEEHREAVEQYSKIIDDLLPDDFRGSGWEMSSAKQILNILPHLDLNKKYSFSKVDGGTAGMGMTTIPEEKHNHSYDQYREFLMDTLGKERLLNLMGVHVNKNEKETMDYHDPTDIALSTKEASERIKEELDAIREKYDGEDLDVREQELLDEVNNLKRTLASEKESLPISLKKIKSGDGHAIIKNISKDQTDGDADNVKIDYDLTGRTKTGKSSTTAQWGTQENNLADMKDNFAMYFDYTDELNDNDQLKLPFIIHSGDGVMNVDPWAQAQRTKVEAEQPLQVEDAKIGSMPHYWFDDPEVTEMLNYDENGGFDRQEEQAPISFADKYGGILSDIGLEQKVNKGGGLADIFYSRRFNEDEVAKIKRLAKEVQEYDGKFKPQFKLPEGQTVESFIDSLIDADNTLEDMRPEDVQVINDKNEDGSKVSKEEKKRRRGLNPITENTTPEQQQQLTDKFGGVPHHHFRSRARSKIRQLRFIKLMQDLEKSGNLDKFMKDKIYKKAFKMGREYSPHIVLG